MKRLKNASLLLARFGARTDYDIVLDVYEADQYGVPVGLPIGSAKRPAADVDFTDYYNFVFDPVIDTDAIRIVLVLHQSVQDSNNFILWLRSDVSEGAYDCYAIDTYTASTDSNMYESGYVYGYGTSDGADFFDVFQLHSGGAGYSQSESYGFELTNWESNTSIQRCFRLYDQFNEIVFDNSGAKSQVNAGETVEALFANRQQFQSGYKQNVAITDDRVTLRDIGSRLMFTDTGETIPTWSPTNRGLAINVNQFAMNAYTDTENDNAYNCLAVAATPEGIFYSLNSCGDWGKIEDPSVSSVNCTAVCFEKDFGETFYVATTSNSNSVVYRFKKFSSTPTSVLTLQNDSVQSMLYLQGRNELIVAGENSIVHNGNTISLPDTIIQLVSWGVDHILACCTASMHEINLQDDTYSPVASTSSIAPIYDCCSFNSHYYVATETGLYISDETTDTPVSECLSWIGHDPNDAIYLSGISVATATTLISAKNKLFVGQLGGVFCSRSGVSFQPINKNLAPNSDVMQLCLNPKDESILHANTKTVKNKVPFITFVIDQSGSMYKRSDDSEKDQYKLLAEIAEQIVTGDVPNPDARFQVITFSSKAELSEQEGAIDRKGAVNMYGGFVPYSTGLKEAIQSLQTHEHYKTPLYETLWASLNGLYRDGASWAYDDGTSGQTDRTDADQDSVLQEYYFDVRPDVFFQNSSKIMILLTDGRDTNSIKTLQDILEGDNRFAGIRNLDLKLYIVAYGSQSDLDTLGKFNLPEAEIIYIRDRNLDDYNRALTYISNKEKYRYREGVYRRDFFSPEEVNIQYVEIQCSIPEHTEIRWRYRTSSNRYDLVDFTDFETVAGSGTTRLQINKPCRFFEIEFRLKSLSVNESPSIHKIKVNYVKASQDFIVLAANTNPNTNPFSQIHLSANIGVRSDGEPDYSHFLDQHSTVPTLVNGLFSPTSSFHREVFQRVGIETRAIAKCRVSEKTSTVDYFVYKANNGPWTSSQQTTVYSNGKPVNAQEYYANPQKATITFFVPRRTSEKITLDIESENVFRLGLGFSNTSASKDILLSSLVVQYLSDTQTKASPRKAIDASPSAGNGASYIKVESDVENNADLAVAGSNTYISVTYIVTSDLNVDSKIRFEMCEFVDVPDEDTYLVPQQNGISAKLSANADEENSVLISCSRTGTQLSFSTENDINVITVTSGSLRKNDKIYIAIGGIRVSGKGYSTILKNTSATGHLIENGCAGSSRFCIGVAQNENGIPEVSDLNKAEPEVNLSSRRVPSYIHISTPTTIEGNSVYVTLTVTDANGIICFGSTDTIRLTLTSLTSNFYSDLGVYSLKSSENGTKKVRVTLPTKDIYQLVAKVESSPEQIASRSSAILQEPSTMIYWGDLNAKSVFGHGRQSPSFVFEYARDVAGLDFVAIADDISMLDDASLDKYLKIADFFNVEGEFVTFPALEWNGGQSIGSKVLVFEDNFTPSTTQIINSKTTTELYNSISIYKPIVISELCGYNEADENVKKYNVNWKNYPIDTELECAIEVYSEHGNIESYLMKNTNGLVNPASQSSRSYAADSLCMGNRIGFVGSSGSTSSRSGLYAGELVARSGLPKTNNNRGLTAVLCSDKSRNSIHNAIKAGKTYATTGSRTYMDFRLGNHSIGDTVNLTRVTSNGEATLASNPEFTYKVIPTSDFADVELVRVIVDKEGATTQVETIGGGRVSPAAPNGKVEDTSIANFMSNASYFLRARQSDGHMAWTSPIFCNLV